MTSAENSILKPPNLKFFWGRITPDPPKRCSPSTLAMIMPPLEKTKLRSCIHEVQNCHAGEQKLHWDKTNRKMYIILNGNFFCLSCCSVAFSLQHGHIWPHSCIQMQCNAVFMNCSYYVNNLLMPWFKAYP